MKIPGVTYGQVQSMGRRDVGAPIREAAAAEQASSAWSNSMRQGLDTADKILNDIATDKNTKAMNVYHEKKLQWQADNREMTAEERVEAVTNGDVVYNTADDAARAEAGKVIDGDNRAQLMFDKDADRANVQYGSNWNNQVISWHKDDQLAEADNLILKAVQRRDFDEAERIINQGAQSGLYTRVETEKMLVTNNAQRVDSTYNTAISSAISTEDRNNLHARINAEPELTDDAREKKHDQHNNMIIEKDGAIYRDQLQRFVDTIGLSAAVAGGEEMLITMSTNIDQDVSGLNTEKAQHASIMYFHSILNEFKTRLGTKTGEDIRSEAADRNDLATTKKGTPSANAQDDRVVRDYYKHPLIGKGRKYDMSQGWDNQSLLSGTDAAKSVIVDIAAQSKSGFIDSRSLNVMDAGITSNNPQEMEQGIFMLSEFHRHNPNTLRSNMHTGVKDVVDMYDAVGPEESLTLLIAAKGRTKLDEGAAKAKFIEEKYDLSAFDSTMKEQAPHIDGGWFWFDATPKFREGFKRGVEDLVPRYMALTNGDVEASYKIAINRKLRESNVDQITGHIVEKPFATSVHGGERDGGKAFHDDIKSSFENETAINNGEIPDYTYYPTRNFDPLNNPSYLVVWKNDDAEIKVMGYTADVNQTEGGKQYLADVREEQAEYARQHHQAKLQQLARTNADAYENAPIDVKARIIVSDLEESAGSYMNRVGAASKALADTLGEVGGMAHDVMNPKRTEKDAIREQRRAEAREKYPSEGTRVAAKRKRFEKQAAEAGIK